MSEELNISEENSKYRRLELVKMFYNNENKLPPLKLEELILKLNNFIECGSFDVDDK